MKLCLTTWLFHHPLQQGTVDPARVFRFFGSDLQARSVEVPKTTWPDWSDAGVKRLKALATEHGLEFGAIAAQNHFNETDPKLRHKEVDLVKEFIDHAAVLQAKVLNVFFAGWGDPAQAVRLYEEMLKNLLEVTDYAAQRRVVLGVEAHGPGTKNAREMLALVRRVNSPWLKLAMDSGNLDHAPHEGLEELMPHVCAVHYKSGYRDAQKVSHPVDTEKFFKIVKDSGYTGEVSLESLRSGCGSLESPKGDLFDEVRQAAEFLKPFLA